MTHDAKNISREIGIDIAANYQPKRDCRQPNASNGRNTPEPNRTTKLIGMIIIKMRLMMAMLGYQKIAILK